MKKSLILLALSVSAALAAAASHCFDTFVASARTVRFWASAGLDWVLQRIPLNPVDARHLEGPRTALIGAAQFLGRMIRRDRPVVSPRWRMCPSV